MVLRRLLYGLGGALIILGCGGGGGAIGGGGGGGNSLTTPVKLTVKAPVGFGVPVTQMKLAGGTFANASLDSAGSSTVTMFSAGRQLVGVLDSAGDPILMGLVSPGRQELNARSTAVALMYFYVGGYLASADTQTALVEAIESHPRTEKLAIAFEAALKASPKALVNQAAAFRAEATAGAREILARSQPAAATISPYPGEKSGVSIEYGSEKNQVLAKNRYRRRALLFVDQLARVNNSGAETPDFKHIGSVEIKPALGTVYSTDIMGNLGGAPKETLTEPVTVPDPPTGTDKLKLKAAVVGPGSGEGTAYPLTTSQQAAYHRLLKKSFYGDYLLGVLNCVLANTTLEGLGPQQRRTLYDLMQSTVDAEADAIVPFVESRFPNAQTEMIEGDMRGALTHIVDQIWTNTATQNAVAQFYVDFFKKVPDFPFQFDTSNVGKMLSWLNKAIDMKSAKDIVSSALGDLPQGRDWQTSNRIETWDVDTNRVTVTLTPKSSKVDARGTETSVKLTAKATNLSSLPAGTVSYKFTTKGKHGTLRNNSGGDLLMIESAEDFVYYNSRVGLSATFGVDDVAVEVYVDRQGTKEKVGSAKATVEVVAKSDIELLPRKQSIKKNTASKTIIAKTQYPNLLSEGKLKLRWNIENGLGKLNVTAGQLTDKTNVMFTAGDAEGTEIVTCEIVDAASGETLSTASATVIIEARTSIVYGSIRYVGHFTVTDGWYESGSGIGFEIPKVAGAKSYSVRCYNFNDTAYFGTSITRSCDANGNGADNDLGPDDKSLPTKGANGTFFFGLTGGAGWGPWGGGEIPDMRAEAYKSAWRFAGMIIEVTVTY